jgi:hypothetical protein
VDAFYTGKVAEYTLVLESFLRPSAHNLTGLAHHQPRSARYSVEAWGGSPDLRAVKSLYIDLVRLQNFVRLNGTGFRKIVKKVRELPPSHVPPAR